MLQVKNLTKVYKSDKGSAVTALKDVSVNFGDRGLIFLLGKSGSGKSTLLNLLGGIDTATSGEIVVGGRSSASFSPADYDAYRNTLVGFIFQEYNLMPDYNVAGNIAMALQLQGKTATREQVENALRQVDLVDKNGQTLYGRRTGELSGGQKQRVAIARALIKNPRIILADEPTGALDSRTGEQLFELLKKLSEEKLIIVVSHDEEFAETYAKRIIELKDGEIISDRTRGEDGFRPTPACTDAAKSTAVKVEDGETAGSGGERDKDGASVMTAAADSRPSGSGGGNDLFIGSKLPLKRAFSMGAMGLKHKIFRLVSSVLLSVVAFTVFAMSIAMSVMNFEKAEMRTLLKNGQRTFTLYVHAQDTAHDYEVFTDAQLQMIRDYNGGRDGMVVGCPADEPNIYYHLGNSAPTITSNNPYVNLGLLGNFLYSHLFAELDPQTGEEDALLTKDPRFKDPSICRLPEDYTEIAITDVRADMFMRYGYTESEEAEIETITSPDDLIGKKYGAFTICGVFATEQSFFKKYDVNGTETPQGKIDGFWRSMCESIAGYGFVKTGYFKNHENQSEISRVMLKSGGKLGKDMALIKKLNKDLNKKGLVVDIASAYSQAKGNVSLFKDLFFIGAIVVAALFSIFSALMTMNFLTTSIAFRKKELGTLRALGATKRDIVTVCLMQSLLLTCINFILTLITAGVISAVMNAAYNIAIFSIWPLPAFLTFLLCFGVSALATILPVRRIADKKPIDIINGR